MNTSQAMTSVGSKYHVPALEKGLDILEALARVSHPVALTELARQLERSPSELFRLLVALEARGYVNKNSTSGGYSLSLKLYELAHQQPFERTLMDAASVPMEEFVRRTNESCHLSVVEFGKMIVLKETLTPGLLRLSVAPGLHYPALHTSSGRLFLAYQPPNRMSALLDTYVEYQELNEEQKLAQKIKLQKIRAAELESSVNENHIGVQDAAVPVGNAAMGLIAVLASTWLTAVSNPAQTDSIIQELRACALQIGAAMGLSDDGTKVEASKATLAGIHA